jgi:calcium-dependent protein kinase
MFPKCGTPGYVAPEILQLKNRESKYSPVCDVFSAGVIFYKLLTGKSLFTGEEPDKISLLCNIKN